MIPRALQNLLGIGRATTIDDSNEVQTMQVTEGAAGSGFADRVIDKVKRVTEFGFSSAPPIDAEVVMFRRGGDRSCSMVIGTSHRPSRPRGLQPGDTVLYDVRGAVVKLTAGGLLIDAAGLPVVIQNASEVTIDAPTVHLTGNLVVDGTIAAAGTVTGLSEGSEVEIGALRDAYNAHKHTGVSSGSASTGATDHAA